MEIEIVGEVSNGELTLINSKGCDTLEIDLEAVNLLSLETRDRFIGLGKQLFKMTKKSYKKLRREFQKRGSLYMFDYSKRS